MSSTLVIVAALHREIASFVTGWDKTTLGAGVSAFTRDRVAVVHAGMGSKRVALAVNAALRAYEVDALLSAGLAGGCDPSVSVGDIFRPAEVIDAQTGEHYVSDGASGSLVSSTSIADVAEKRRLYHSYKAAAVDMEAATVARLARAHDVGFIVIKAISDDASFEMKELALYATADGHFREAAFAIYAVTHPGMWGRLRRLSANSRIALRALHEDLNHEIEQYRMRKEDDQ